MTFDPREPLRRYSASLAGRVALLVGALLAAAQPAAPQDFVLTTLVLVNSQVPAGFNTDPRTPGEFQRFAERYLEHLQVPYELVDVASQGPPPDLLRRQLILAAHSGLDLSAAWQTALSSAVQQGVGFVNLDAAPGVGQQAHIRAIFGATGSAQGAPATAIRIPAAVLTDGSAPHYIALLQRRFRDDPPGDRWYSFHADSTGVVRPIRSTVLTNATGAVIATAGSDPLIVATTYGAGRAVHFGTLEYLRADRFGFMMGLDDLFWRSLVWAARKPFVVRGYPRFWSVQMDDTLPGWGFRVRDMFDPALTGERAPDGTGGPWRVTGYVFTDYLAPGSAERASVIADIRAGRLHVSPHARRESYGDLYWVDPFGQPLTDTTWSLTLDDIRRWIAGYGGSDQIPFISRSMVPHFWNLSRLTGAELWDALGVRYITEIQRPGIDFYSKTDADRLRLRPFRVYELPPMANPDENYPIYHADNYVVDGRTFFNFATQVIDLSRYDRQDLAWPNSGRPVEETVDQFQYYTWRLWSSLAPVQIYTHDGSSNYILSTAQQRREVIRVVSSWLNQERARHVFMQDLGDYMRARTASVLVRAEAVSGQLSLTFAGNAATADGVPVATELLFFDGDNEGLPVVVPGFVGGAQFVLPAPTPAPVIWFSPATLTFTHFRGDAPPPGQEVRIANAGTGTLAWSAAASAPWLQLSPRSGQAPSVVTVGVDVAGLPAGTYLGNITITAAGAANSPQTIPVRLEITEPPPPSIASVSPAQGTGGMAVTITGSGFLATSQVWIGTNPVSNLTVSSQTTMTAVVPEGPAGPTDVRVTTAGGTATLPGGFTYLPPGSVLLFDGFDDGDAAGWTLSPMGNGPGWSVVGGVWRYDGRGKSQQYFGNPGWTNYSVETRFRLASTLNWPGGLRGRVNPTTGAGYLAYLLPRDGEVRLLRLAGWDVDGAGTVVLARATGISYEIGYHVLRMEFEGAEIRVYLDTRLIIRATDTTYAAGTVALDGETQAIEFDYVAVTTALTPPTLLVSPTTVGFAVEQGAAPAPPQAFTVQNAGGGTLTWNATPSVPWLTVTPTGGTAPAAPAVSVDASGLGPGTYEGAVVVVASGAAGSPQQVQVTLTVTPPPPPTITGVSPSFGAAAGGTRVRLSGRGFVPGTAVVVGGVPASDVAIDSSTSLLATMPPGTPGPADITVVNENGTATLSGGFTYVVAGTLLMSDNFDDGAADGWTISPLGNPSGWSVSAGVYTYNGGGHTQSFRGDPGWGDYTVEVAVRLSSLDNYPGGIRGRVDPATGASYAIWLYPAIGEIGLFRAGGWHIDGSGLTVLGRARGVSFAAGTFHRVRVIFQGTQIDVYFDGGLVLSAQDSTLTGGMIALDVSNRPVGFDDVRVWFGAVPPPPRLAVTPGQLSFDAEQELDDPTPQTLSITNAGPGGLGWSAAVDAPWLEAAPSSGTAPGATTVRVVASGLAPGVYDATVTVSAPGAEGSPQTIPVRLTVRPPSAPTIDGISPSFGREAGGTRVRITGTGFRSGSTVTIGGRRASNVVVENSTTLTATTPAGALGPADVTVTTPYGSATLVNGFNYLGSGSVLLADNFDDGVADGWNVSALGNGGGWSVLAGALTYNGGGHTQLYRGDPAWTDYALEVSVRLTSLQNYPGGLRARVNPATGAGYALWLYPASGQLGLFRATAWNIDSPGLVVLGFASGIPFAPSTFHRLRLVLQGPLLEVYFDGTLVLSVTDTAYSQGVVALDVSNQPIAFDDVRVLFDPPAPPTLSRVSPVVTEPTGGGLLHVIGSGFVEGASVTVGGQPATNVVVESTTSLIATLPAGVTGPADVTVTTLGGSVTRTGAVAYLPAGSVLVADDFNDGVPDGWTISPLGNTAGWRVTDRTLTYNGGGHTQLYRGDPAWTDYALEVSVRLTSLQNYPGGLRARVNPATGAGYALWLYPASGQLGLFRATAWNIDSPGLVVLGFASGIPFAPSTFHRLRLVLQGPLLEVYFDGTLVLSVTDTAYSQGVVALDVSNQPIAFDDVVVTIR